MEEIPKRKHGERRIRPCNDCGKPARDYRCSYCRRQWKLKNNPEGYKAAIKRARASRAARGHLAPSQVGQAASAKSRRYNTSGLRPWLYRLLFNATSHCLRRGDSPPEITADDLLDIYGKQNGLCGFCGLSMTIQVHDPKSISLDRKDPTGPYSVENVHLVRKWLNLGRGRTEINQFRELLNELSVRDPGGTTSTARVGD